MDLFKVNFRSFVHNTVAESPVELPLAGGEGKYKRLDELIHENIPKLDDETWYWNAPSMPNGQLQTMYAAAGKFEHVDRIYYGRRLITFENDGSMVSADYVVDPPKTAEEWQESVAYHPEEGLPPFPVRTRYLRPEEVAKLHTPENESKPLCILLHGLTGGSHESYVRASITSLEEAGFDCVVLNSRGCARTKITTPQLFCALMTDDIRRFIKLIRKEQPNRRLYAAGYSLGASILANYLGQEGDETEIEGACAVAAPWDLDLCYHSLHDSWLGRNVYSPQMCKNLQRLIKNHRNMLAESPEFKAAEGKKLKYISDFDSHYTAPFFGFDTATDYYRKASPVNRLLNVRTPLLILNAHDDPVVGEKALPYFEVAKNPYAFMSVTDVGGHLGWFQPGGARWFPDVISKFFSAMHENVDPSREPKATIVRKEPKFHGDRLVLD